MMSLTKIVAYSWSALGLGWPPQPIDVQKIDACLQKTVPLLCYNMKRMKEERSSYFLVIAGWFSLLISCRNNYYLHLKLPKMYFIKNFYNQIKICFDLTLVDKCSRDSNILFFPKLTPNLHETRALSICPLVKSKNSELIMNFRKYLE